MLRRLFPFRSRTAEAHLESIQREIAALERKAWSSPWSGKATLYERLGDLHLQAGDRERALGCYGVGIDAYLLTARFARAALLCRKTIHRVPEVIRARCTLAFVLLGEGHFHAFREELGDYVHAARRAGQERLAVRRLGLMASVTDHFDIRRLLVHHLEELGHPAEAQRARETAAAERNGLGSAARLDQRARWARVLQLELTGLSDRDHAPPPPESCSFANVEPASAAARA